MAGIIQVGLVLVLTMVLSSSGASGATLCEDSIFSACMHTNECQLRRNKLLATIPTLNKTFSISLEFIARGFQPEWTNVIHFTEGDNCCGYGQRIPALFVHGASRSAIKNKLQSSFAISGNGDFSSTKSFLRDQWIKVQISQTQEGRSWRYTVLVDGETMDIRLNTQPKAFSNVKVYAADPWYNSLKGSIRNLVVNADTSKPCEVCKPNKKCQKKQGRCIHKNEDIPKGSKKIGYCNKRAGCRCIKD